MMIFVFLGTLPCSYLSADVEKNFIRTFPQKKISLELKDMDIVEVLKLLSKESGLNIVVAGNVRGNITLFLTQTNIQEAFETIVESSNLAYEWGDEVIKVMTAQDYERVYGQSFHKKTAMKLFPLRYAHAEAVQASVDQLKSSIGKIMVDARANALVIEDVPNRLTEIGELIKRLDVPIETRIFTLGYGKAKEVEPLISDTLGTAGQVKVDERTNTLAVTTSPERLEQVAQLVGAFDIRKGAVKIEAKILQITLNDTYKMGVDWEYVFGKNALNGLDFKSSFQLAGKGALSPGGEVSVGTLAKNNYQLFVQLLKTIGETNLLSSPSITANHGEEASILVGTNQAYVTQTVVQGGTGPTTTSESVNFVDVGVKLHVTPIIAPDGYVSLKVKPEVSSVATTIKTSNGNTIPIIATSEAETTVLVKDENTVVIAGLIEDKKSDTTSKIPLFGELPIIGAIFRARDNEIKKTELVIFLTPKIVDAAVAGRETDHYFHSEQGERPGTLQEEMKKLYYDYIYQRIANAPIKLSESLEATVAKVSLRFIVKRNGELGAIQVMRGSTADQRLCSAAVNKLVQSAPFPEFPEEIVEKELILKVDIYFGGKQKP